MLRRLSCFINVSPDVEDMTFDVYALPYRIHMNLLDRVLHLYKLFSLPERLKEDNTNLASHLPRACLMLAQAGFPSSRILSSITQMFWQDLKDNA
ncbi:hypothetical protein Tco_0884642 [Tanacetum coccineum]